MFSPVDRPLTSAVTDMSSDDMGGLEGDSGMADEADVGGGDDMGGDDIGGEEV